VENNIIQSYDFFIPGNVPSSKNGRRIIRQSGKVRSIGSKACLQYKAETAYIYANEGRRFRELIDGVSPPYFIGFTFLRKTTQKFDYINMAQIVQDSMVLGNWLPDDNCDILIPVFKHYRIDRKIPGVIISLLMIDQPTG